MTEQESVEVRLSVFKDNLEKLRLIRVNDATLSEVRDLNKLSLAEMDLWDRYVALIKSASGLSSEQLVEAKEKLDVLASDVKHAISNTKDNDLGNFFAWMNNRLMGLRGMVDYLDDAGVRDDILKELTEERTKLGL